MGEYSKSTTVDVAPDRLFEYLSDVRNLPNYMPQLTSVEPLEGDKVRTTATIAPGDEPEHEVEGEAWMRVVEAGRTLEWGSEGPNDYHGALEVDEGDSAGTSKLTVRLNTVRDEGSEVEEGLEHTLNGLRDAVERAESGLIMAEKELKSGDQVEWNSHGGKGVGKVEKKITTETEAGGRKVKASKDEPQYLVKSDKSGGEAVHKPGALKKTREKVAED